MGESMKGLSRSHRCTEVSEAMLGQKVTVMGWVQKRRDLGKLIFVDLRDRSGILQVVFDSQELSKDLFSKAETIRSEYVLAVSGVVASRGPEGINPNRITGKIEIHVEDFRILSEAETPPFEVMENSTVKDDLRLKYRYLDLRRPDLQRNLMMRHRVAAITREFLNQEGFLEIETPMLTKSTPEGARDYLVPSRIHPGHFYALPQSPQLFKQLLMVSGLDRYYQITKCFRDEDLRADRQPEFTQIDMELSFVEAEDVMNINERLLKKLFKEVMNVDVSLPIPRMTYQEAMDRFGSDKPDIRFGMELVDISEIVKDGEFGVFKNAVAAGGSVRGINGKGCGSFSRKQIDRLGDVAKDFGGKGLAWIVIEEDGSYRSPIAKFFSEAMFNQIVEALEGEPGDLLLFCADENDIVYDVLGNLRFELAKRLDLLKDDDYQFLWVTEFPLLEWSKEQERYVAKHHPFTMPMEEDLALLDTEPEKARAKAYDIVLNGVEIGGGSIRIHQRDIQEKMFEVLGFSKEVAYERFGFLLKAFQYGTPPHGGLAYGLDRIVMLMAGADSIRDVIAFPKVKDATCLMTEAPGIVEEKQAQELHIQIIKQEEEEK